MKKRKENEPLKTAATNGTTISQIDEDESDNDEEC